MKGKRVKSQADLIVAFRARQQDRHFGIFGPRRTYLGHSRFKSPTCDRLDLLFASNCSVSAWIRECRTTVGFLGDSHDIGGNSAPKIPYKRNPKNFYDVT